MQLRPALTTLFDFPSNSMRTGSSRIVSALHSTGRSIVVFVSWLVVAALAISVSAARVKQLHRRAVRNASAAHMDRVLRYRRSHRVAPCPRIQFKDAA
ncbi:hypothetical protein PSP20601_00446 [Pandoraea sputorum]|uniref:Transmembrane protein n=1 Tax=Pandoraea sputorum TaxID=93222 RepID=A0A239S7B8_9BURK|nr:hypothetical protein NA29_06275 [Pandoraea sputorum]SNU81336.1 Uncharacterised protein [Pandoraea sputorum]VVD68015.1 hypothetical protein PSP20601_00446 [Pandoraea sputorum]